MQAVKALKYSTTKVLSKLLNLSQHKPRTTFLTTAPQKETKPPFHNTIKLELYFLNVRGVLKLFKNRPTHVNIIPFWNWDVKQKVLIDNIPTSSLTYITGHFFLLPRKWLKRNNSLYLRNELWILIARGKHKYFKNLYFIVIITMINTGRFQFLRNNTWPGLFLKEKRK